ncbi:MAG: hypothetical protein IH991_04480 [Planctomycetes bacterium]|nr:hypothetical protein [Planctomycetota bacterium]
MNIRRRVVGLAALGAVVLLAASKGNAHAPRDDQTKQAQDQDGRYFVYMRGIT